MRLCNILKQQRNRGSKNCQIQPLKQMNATECCDGRQRLGKHAAQQTAGANNNKFPDSKHINVVLPRQLPHQRNVKRKEKRASQRKNVARLKTDAVA